MQASEEPIQFSSLGRVSLHALGWTLFFSLIIAFVSSSFNGESAFIRFLSFPFLSFYLIYLGVFYLNYLYLFPRLFLKRQYWLYFFLIAICFISIYCIQPFEQLHSMSAKMPPAHMAPPGGPQRFAPRPPGRIDIISLISFFLVWAVSSGLVVLQYWRKTERRASQAEADKANAELSFLKAQINPHFMFNTLNNIYSMAVSKSELTAPAIMKLSNIMRYVTDEAGENFVGLEDELKCISDYIELQKLRMNNKTQINYHTSGDPGGKKIAPLLLMTFVENVFKYGVSSHDLSEITIEVKIDQSRIHFRSHNRIMTSGLFEGRDGIGIKNTKARLDHLYPGKYDLQTIADDYYTVQLNLDL